MKIILVALALVFVSSTFAQGQKSIGTEHANKNSALQRNQRDTGDQGKTQTLIHEEKSEQRRGLGQGKTEQTGLLGHENTRTRSQRDTEGKTQHSGVIGENKSQQRRGLEDDKVQKEQEKVERNNRDTKGQETHTLLTETTQQKRGLTGTKTGKTGIRTQRDTTGQKSTQTIGTEQGKTQQRRELTGTKTGTRTQQVIRGQRAVPPRENKVVQHTQKGQTH